MPIVNIVAPGVFSPIDTPKNFAVTPGKADIDAGSDAPDWTSTFRAAFRQDNTMAAGLSSPLRGVSNDPEDGYEPWLGVKGTKYEPEWKSFVDVRNRAREEAVKRQIDQETEDRRTLEAAPWWQSVPAQMVAGTLDLPTLIPGGAFIRGAKGGYALGKSALNVGTAAAVGAGVQEAALHAIQETRPLTESAVNIGAAGVLGGILGAAGGKLLSNAEWTKAVADLERGFDPVPVPETPAIVPAGAAATEVMPLEGNTIAGRAAGVVAAATSKMNPLLRGFQSPSAVYRDTLGKLVENSVYLKKNIEGIASEPAAETLMKEWNAGLAKAVTATDDAFSSYRKAGGQLSRSEFREEVGRAMRRADESDIPEVTKVAKAWRSQVFDPLKDAAISAKLLPEDVSVETAASYFSRMWNRNKLIAREGQFKQIVADWVQREQPRWRAIFDAETAERAAKLKDEKLKEFLTERRIEREARFEDPQGNAKQVADEVFDTLTGKAETGQRQEFITIKARGPLKERTFNIPDELVEEFLESDVDLVGRRYSRVMGADVEIANKFGSLDMKDQIAAIREDYKHLRGGISDEKQLKRLDDREKADVADLEALRDLLRGTRNESPVERNYGKITRIFNHINYIRSMGEVALASVAESVRPAMVHGLLPYMKTMAQLGTNLDGIKMSVAEAQLAGNVVERVLGHRLATITDIIDPYASRGPTEAFVENLSNVASKWNGIRMLTDMQKSIASVMTQNRILGNAESFGSVKGKEKAYMAYLGIDEGMAGRIAKQFADHGETVDGVKVANTENWTDKVAVRTYRAAMNKDIDSIITTKGVADVPLFAQTAMGRALLQFKSFALASHQRVLLRGLQEDQARFLSGLIAMSTIGMMTTYLKALSGNREEKLADFAQNPGWWISEGIDKSGVLSVPMELSNIFEKATGLNPLKSPLKAFDEGSRLSQRTQNRSDIGSLLGPTVGFGDDLMTALGIPRTIARGDDVTQGQRNAAERLLPFNSYLGMRQLLRHVVNTPD